MTVSARQDAAVLVRSARSWPLWPPYLLFFLMLFLPLVYQPVKAVLLAATLALILLAFLASDVVALHRSVLAWTLFMAATGLLFMLVGMVKGAPGALRVGTVYVLWPLVYSVFVAGATRQKVIDRLFKVLVFGTFAIAIYSLSFTLNVAGLLPDALYVELNQGQAVGFYAGFVDVNLHSTNSLLFLMPFAVAALLTWPRDAEMPVTRSWIWVTLVVSLVFALLSGRRALWLVVGMAPFVALALRLFLMRAGEGLGGKRVVRTILIAVLVMLLGFGILQANFDLDLLSLASRFVAAFDFSGDVGAFLRREQFFALLQGWSEHPFLGSGLGATAPGSVRSIEMLWSYELFYPLLLFQTGIVGFAIYAAATGWVFWMGIRLIRSGHPLGLYMLPVLVGTFCFLVANATNPTIGKFDHIWVIFLPITLINSWLVGLGPGVGKVSSNGKVL